jgi:transposase, IS5 family
MALKEIKHAPEIDLFRMELESIIDHRHALVQLAKQIDWQACQTQFGALYASGVGRPGYPIRLMVGLQLLKQISNVSDEELVRVWTENPYWQHLCGEQYFRHELPIDPSLMTMFRKRIGVAGCEFILGLTVKVGVATKTVVPSSLAVVNVDTTVQEKAITYPTDAKLLNKARISLVKLAKKQGLDLRQSYCRVGQSVFAKSARYAHARQYNRAKAQTKKLRTYLGRVIRDIERKANDLKPFKRLLETAKRIHSQPRKRSESDAPKVYSVHEPQVECIAKGKVHKKYEFGVKVGLVTTSKESFVVGCQALHGNPYDGHTLQACLDQAQTMTGVPIDEVYADRGYKGHGVTSAKVWIAGAKRGVTEKIKAKLKRRNAIEPVIGHMKADGRLGRNFLKGKMGDEMNAILCAAGHNLRKILNKLRLFYAQQLWLLERMLELMLFGVIGAKRQLLPALKM